MTRVVTFYPGERAKCPARVPRRSAPCGGNLQLLAGPRTSITVRVVALRPEPGEAVQFCRCCKTMLAIQVEAVG